MPHCTAQFGCRKRQEYSLVHRYCCSSCWLSCLLKGSLARKLPEGSVAAQPAAILHRGAGLCGAVAGEGVPLGGTLVGSLILLRPVRLGAG